MKTYVIFAWVGKNRKMVATQANNKRKALIQAQVKYPQSRLSDVHVSNVHYDYCDNCDKV
jgi:hypothetical protein